MTLFGVFTPDASSNYESKFNDSWYALNGSGIFIQMLIYFGLNNLVFTYGLDVFPIWCSRRKDMRVNYTAADLKNNIPNTKCET